MSHTNPRAKFDYKSWFDRHVAELTKAALDARDAAFAEKHAETPLPELARYLARQAQTLRHTPSPCEVDGGEFIARRFGDWTAALRAAKLPPASEKKLTDTARYRNEKKKQAPLFYEESERRKKEKRAKATRRCAAQQARLNEKRQLEQEKMRLEPSRLCNTQRHAEAPAPGTAG